MRSIVLVEDDKDNRLLAQTVLGHMYDVQAYATGFEAMEAMKSWVPDLIILDISLPGMDGVEVLSRLRSDERLKNVPVIALTAQVGSGDRNRYLSAGFDDYIEKPIVHEEAFLQVIERSIRQKV